MNTSINNSIENLWNSYNEINNDINFSFGTPFRPLNYRCNEMIIMCEIVEKMQEFYDELYANEEYDVLFDEANKVYDEFESAYDETDFMKSFNSIRKDIISSDREALAFLLAIAYFYKFVNKMISTDELD